MIAISRLPKVEVFNISDFGLLEFAIEGSKAPVIDFVSKEV